MKELGRDLLPDEIIKLIDRVSGHLLRKCHYHKTRNDADYPTILGNTSFWLIRNEEQKTLTLGFSQAPRYWNIDEIETAILQEEHEMFQQMGVPFL